MKVELSPSLVLTDEDAASNYGIPVLVQRDVATKPRAYGPGDLLRYANTVLPAAQWVVRLGALKRDQAELEFCRRFLKQWPAGPQL